MEFLPPDAFIEFEDNCGSLFSTQISMSLQDDVLFLIVVALHLSADCKSGSPIEQLVEAMGSWSAGLGPSPGERPEQEYLLALSAQYQVEHYEDCYNLMGRLKMNGWLSMSDSFGM